MPRHIISTFCPLPCPIFPSLLPLHQQACHPVGAWFSSREFFHATVACFGEVRLWVSVKQHEAILIATDAIWIKLKWNEFANAVCDYRDSHCFCLMMLTCPPEAKSNLVHAPHDSPLQRCCDRETLSCSLLALLRQMHKLHVYFREKKMDPFEKTAGAALTLCVEFRYLWRL